MMSPGVGINIPFVFLSMAPGFHCENFLRQCPLLSQDILRCPREGLAPSSQSFRPRGAARSVAILVHVHS